jgi:hypothetical protein
VGDPHRQLREGGLAVIERCRIAKPPHRGRPTSDGEEDAQDPRFERANTETPALPEHVGGGATAAASAEDELILGVEPLRI